MSISQRFTTADLELLPDVEGWRYEIIDGELHLSKQPDWHHQDAGSRVWAALDAWSGRTGAGRAIIAPGLIFAEDQDVAPDVVWVSRVRLDTLVDAAGHLRGAPELVVEVLSPGSANERRDREVKLALYERQGIDAYWIVDWRGRTVAVYRRERGALKRVATLRHDDVLTSPLLPGFACPVATLWPPSVR